MVVTDACCGRFRYTGGLRPDVQCETILTVTPELSLSVDAQLLLSIKGYLELILKKKKQSLLLGRVNKAE
jgi:hypothetical protein